MLDIQNKKRLQLLALMVLIGIQWFLVIKGPLIGIK